MRPTLFYFVSIFVLGSFSSAMAESYSVKRSVTLKADAAEIWHVMGDFCDIDDWHPAFNACSLKAPAEGGVHRLLTMEGGGQFLEKLIASEPGLSYTYTIVEGPVPITNYVGTMALTRGDSETEVVWSTRFKSDDPEMEALVTNVFETGLAALAEKFPD